MQNPSLPNKIQPYITEANRLIVRCGLQTIRYIFGEQFSPACFSLLYNYKTVLFSSKNRFPFAWICIRCQSDSKDLQIRQEIYPTFVIKFILVMMSNMPKVLGVRCSDQVSAVTAGCYGCCGCAADGEALGVLKRHDRQEM